MDGGGVRVEERVSKRLAELIETGQRVLETRRSLGPSVMGDDRVDSQLALQWSTSTQSLLASVFGADSEHYKAFVRQLEKSTTYSPVVRAFGVLKAAQDDYDNGHLYDLRSLVEAEVFDDFLEQSSQLLAKGYYQAAVVVAGCVLEDTLRALCGRNTIDLSGRPKLDHMNADLAKAGAYNKLMQKRITALADLRNKAAHGEWDAFNRSDVDEMLGAVRRFAEDHLA